MQSDPLPEWAIAIARETFAVCRMLYVTIDYERDCERAIARALVAAYQRGVRRHSISNPRLTGRGVNST